MEKNPMKKIGSLLAVFAAVLCFNSAPAQAGPCFDWACNGAGGCTFDASCSTASPYVWKYDFNFGDGADTGLTGGPSWSHIYSGGTGSNVTLTIYFFSGSGSASVVCPIWHHLFPSPPQPPFNGRCQ
jgi:hypothetical protein